MNTITGFSFLYQEPVSTGKLPGSVGLLPVVIALCCLWVWTGEKPEKKCRKGHSEQKSWQQ